MSTALLQEQDAEIMRWILDRINTIITFNQIQFRLVNMTNAKDFLGKMVDVTIDRPLGSRHPKHGFEYQLNYGFVPDTQSPDGEELDAYVLSITKPIKIFRGRCIAVIHRTNDDDDKLIVVPDDTIITDEHIRQATYFQEQYFQSEIIRSQLHELGSFPPEADRRASAPRSFSEVGNRRIVWNG